MANLFVANTSTQSCVFHWRMPESHKINNITIDAGGQVQVLRDVTDFELKFVVDHHRKYGMRTISEAKQAGGTDASKVVLVYSDSPLPPEVFGISEEVNEDIVANQIQLSKEASAYGMIKTFEQNSELSQGVEAVELEIIEDAPKENDRKGKPLVRQKFSHKLKK